MSVTGASSRAIDSAAVLLHSAAPVAARGSSRSSVLNGPSSRSSNVRRHLADLAIRNRIALPSGKDIALPSPTEVDFTTPHPGEPGKGLQLEGIAARANPAAVALKLPHRIGLGGRCGRERCGSARS